MDDLKRFPSGTRSILISAILITPRGPNQICSCFRSMLFISVSLYDETLSGIAVTVTGAQATMTLVGFCSKPILVGHENRLFYGPDHF